MSTDLLVKDKKFLAIGLRFKKMRKHFNLTLSGLGKKLNVTSGYLSRVENGRHGLSQETVLLLSKEFNINLNWLLTGEGEMLNQPKQQSPLWAQHQTPPFLALIQEDKKEADERHDKIYKTLLMLENMSLNSVSDVFQYTREKRLIQKLLEHEKDLLNQLT